mmetsp:Transcript_29508/g.68501  ORF Transcript_29508/g.68501 Transcript_29508/m.68501 type:complete len:235 (-) Transcript_29508:798-1502(-)
MSSCCRMDSWSSCRILDCRFLEAAWAPEISAMRLASSWRSPKSCCDWRNMVSLRDWRFASFFFIASSSACSSRSASLALASASRVAPTSDSRLCLTAWYCFRASSSARCFSSSTLAVVALSFRFFMSAVAELASSFLRTSSSSVNSWCLVCDSSRSSRRFCTWRSSIVDLASTSALSSSMPFRCSRCCCRCSVFSACFRRSSAYCVASSWMITSRRRMASIVSCHCRTSFCRSV